MDGNPYTHSVLFVCTYNLCRSPIAAALFASMTHQEKGCRWQIGSAGTWAKAGLPAPEGLKEFMALNGLDLNSHISRVVTGNILQGYNLVLTMELGQKEALRVEFPHQAHKVFMVSEMAGVDISISDKKCRDLHDYENVIDELMGWLVKGKRRIESLAVSD